MTSGLDEKLAAANAAQAEKEAVGLRMNEQLRAYNEKMKKAKAGG